MERKVPSTASEEIDLYVRTIYSLLRSTADVQIRALEEVHAGVTSLLHPHVRESFPDTSAFIYSLLRLPSCMPDVRQIVLGQSADVFLKHGYSEVENWQPVSARARRRRCFYNGTDTLACFIASQSDIDDIIPTLTAYQIEWNKLHSLLQNQNIHFDELNTESRSNAVDRLSALMQIPVEDLERLRVIWGNDFSAYLNRIKQQQTTFRVRLLGGSLSDYWRATSAWWDQIEKASPYLRDRPVYFVSSNTHSLANILSGFAFLHEKEIIGFIEQSGNDELRSSWREIQKGAVPASRENFLYYTLKKLQQTPAGKYLQEEQVNYENQIGITRIPSEHSFDIEAQVIEIDRLISTTFDPRLNISDGSFLSKSNAVILNVDYPLGLSSYNILSKVAEHMSPVLGIYILGKAAILNGVRGDVMIPNVVYDEHSENTYLFQNAFKATDVSPLLMYGSVLDNQKAVSVLGTFLQNARIMDVLYREGYTDIEMEAGPYLSAIYEMYRPERHPVNEIVNLYGLPFDLGILHYASDKPLSKGKNLGAGTLSYYGMDSTYATTLAIARRIFTVERRRILETVLS